MSGDVRMESVSTFKRVIAKPLGKLYLLANVLHFAWHEKYYVLNAYGSTVPVVMVAGGTCHNKLRMHHSKLVKARVAQHEETGGARPADAGCALLLSAAVAFLYGGWRHGHA